MALTKDEKVHAIIHSASVSTAGVGAGLAQLPMADTVPITALQVGMINAIALVHGRNITEGTATGILGTLAAGMLGRTISQWLVGWIPGWGNAINAATAATLTEGVGWSAHAFFENLGDEPLSEDDLKERAKQFREG